MTLGTGNKKQLYFLIGLGVLAAYLVYTNVLAGPTIPSQQQSGQTAQTQRPAAATDRPAVPSAPGPGGAPKRAGTSRNRSEEVHWVFMPKRPEERQDPASIDPTLLTARLEKVQAVDLAGGSRNLFQFSTPPPPKEVEKPKGPEPKVAVAQPSDAKPVPPGPPPEPATQPPPYKFYGYSTSRDNGKKTAYFLDGDEILLASEGDTIRRRYKVVRIAPSAVTVEDLDSKKQVTMPLAEESQS